MSIRTGNSEGKITGWGMALGPETITNDDLAIAAEELNKLITKQNKGVVYGS